MSWRLVDDPADAELASALRDWRAEAVDASALARMEQRLAAALAQPRTVPRPAAPWLLGLWAVNAAIALLLAAVSPVQLEHGAAAQPAGLSALEAASRLGVGPRELAAHDAVDPLHAPPWR